MKAESVSVCGNVVQPTDNRKLAARAHEVDTDIRNTVDGMKKSITGLGHLLTEMKEHQLWHFITNPRTEKGFSTLKEYASFRLGPLGKSKIYDLMAVSNLTEGPNPISAEDVEKMGHKKALEVHKLPSKKRTKELIESVINKPLTQVRQIVQQEINKDLPPEERKEPTIPFVRQYPPALVEKFEELEARALNLEGIRDGDMSVSRRAKFMYALLINFEQLYFEELLEADDYAASMEAKRRADDQAAAPVENAFEQDEGRGFPEP